MDRRFRTITRRASRNPSLLYGSQLPNMNEQFSMFGANIVDTTTSKPGFTLFGANTTSKPASYNASVNTRERYIPQPKYFGNFANIAPAHTSRAAPFWNLREQFNQNLQFRPTHLYLVMSSDKQYALTCEKDTFDIFLTPPNAEDPNQWCFLDSDTGGGGDSGTICFFNFQDGYIKVPDTKLPVFAQRNHSIENAMFQFETDGYISLKSSKEQILAFRKPGSQIFNDRITEITGKPYVPGAETPTDSDASKEPFDIYKYPALEIIERKYATDPNYSCKWTYQDVLSLNDMYNENQNSKKIADIEKATEEMKKQMENNYISQILHWHEDSLKWQDKLREITKHPFVNWTTEMTKTNVNPNLLYNPNATGKIDDYECSCKLKSTGEPVTSWAKLTSPTSST